MARVRWATGYARRVISRFRITGPPIDVEALAKQLGAEVKQESFPDEISGALYRAADRAIIAVNKGHLENRRRFTIAHELGHYLLHRDSPAYYDQEHQVGLHFRAKVTGTSWDAKEIEANRFAAELLMPRRLLLARVGDRTEIDASMLAAEFRVSQEAMTYRLAELRFV